MKYFILLLALVTLLGCGPDLTIVNTGMASYCNVDSAGNLVVKVKNIGDEAAGISKTCIDFGTFGVQAFETPAIPAGGEESLPSISFPRGCFNSDCSFSITVDCDNAIGEKNESNNNADGCCIG